MTHDDLDRRIADVVQAARDAGMSDETIIDVLLDHVEVLREQLAHLIHSDRQSYFRYELAT